MTRKASGTRRTPESNGALRVRRAPGTRRALRARRAQQRNQSGTDRVRGAWRAPGTTRAPMTEDMRAPGTECFGRAPETYTMPETRRAPGDRRAPGTDGRAPLGTSSRRGRLRCPRGNMAQSPPSLKYAPAGDRSFRKKRLKGEEREENESDHRRWCEDPDPEDKNTDEH